MNREDIIRMAREVWSAGEVYVGPSEKNLERFAALVAAAEREACAKWLEDVVDAPNWAEQIRARKENT